MIRPVTVPPDPLPLGGIQRSAHPASHWAATRETRVKLHLIAKETALPQGANSLGACSLGANSLGAVRQQCPPLCSS